MNRLLLPYMNEAALLLVRRCASINEIERAAKSFGMPMGPIHAVRRGGPRRGRARRAARWSRRFPIASCRRSSCKSSCERGRIGQKVGKGFFDYGPAKGGKPPRGTDSDEVAAADRRVPHRRRAKVHAEELTDRLFLPMLVEATRALEDSIVPDVRDVDLA